MTRVLVSTLIEVLDIYYNAIYDNFELRFGFFFKSGVELIDPFCNNQIVYPRLYSYVCDHPEGCKVQFNQFSFFISIYTNNIRFTIFLT